MDGGRLILIVLSLLSGPSTGFEFNLNPTAPVVNVTKAYEAHFRPNNGAVADTVSVSVELLGVQDINENKMELTLDLILRKSWTDPRLSSAVEKPSLFVNEVPNVWKPDLYFVNAVSSAHPDGNSRSLRLKPGGEVILSERLISRVHCPMAFAKFPFDRQTCTVNLRSYGYTMIHLDMVWKGSIEAETVNLYSLEYSLIAVDQTSVAERTGDGEHRILGISITMGRSGLSYFSRAMFPALFLAFFSYVSLFFGKTKVKIGPGPHVEDETKKTRADASPNPLNILLVRLAIAGLSFLVFIISAQITLLSTPRTGGVTALDVWFYVFGGIVSGILLLTISLLIQLHRRDPKDDEIPSGRKPCLAQFQSLLIYAIPIFLIVFVVIYFAAILI